MADMVTISRKLKNVIGYYGGKYHLLNKILPLIPEHRIYTEVFFGGGSVFFAKEPAKIEAINDTNKFLVNFYKVAKSNFKQLKKAISTSLYSEEEYQKAKRIYLNTDEKKYNKIAKAWAVFVISNQSYLHAFTTGWKYCRNRNKAVEFANKKEAFTQDYVKRLEYNQIFCLDALRVLQNMGDPTAFHFIDPPYIGANQGHYSGYTIEQFENLLKTCQTLKGKFLLTTYPSQILSDYSKKNGWYQIAFELRNSASRRENARKTEVFTMNYMPTKILS